MAEIIDYRSDRDCEAVADRLRRALVEAAALQTAREQWGEDDDGHAAGDVNGDEAADLARERDLVGGKTQRL